MNIIILVLLPFVYSLDNGLALTPAMGWNSWNKFGCGINEDLIKGVADAFISSGLAEAGYQYVNLDDCWQVSRDPQTHEIQADPNAFPSGIKALADYIHSKGLKFGIYSDAGAYTCQHRPGSLYYEALDASTYAIWGVDYLKYDNCFNLNLSPQYRYPRMMNALNETGRSIYYSICEWQNEPWTWAPPVGNSWRTHDDINDNWSDLISIIDLQVNISTIGGIGGWNDPDMLEVGNGGMTVVEYQSHFALWAYMKAPLIIGCDVRNMTNDTFTILSNKEIIAINQDTLGKPAVRYANTTSYDIWGGPLSDGFAALFFNRDTVSVNITVNLTLFNLTGQYNGRDLVAHEDLGVIEGNLTTEVQSHGVFCVKLTQQKFNQEVTVFLA